MKARDELVLAGYRAGYALGSHLPAHVFESFVGIGGRAAWYLAGPRRRMLERHLRRAAGPELRGMPLRRAVQAGFASYLRYYLESFRLPGLSAEDVDAGFTTEGTADLWAALDERRGAILALPHLGGWEWAARWLTSVRGHRVTVVVEPLQPRELFDWFVDFRSSLGMDIVELGPDAGRSVLEAIGRNHIVCLLSDRDIVGDGVPVEFFGEQTTLPAGPAVLSLRSGAPVFPTAVYFQPGGGHLGSVRPALSLEREGRLREDVARVTQDLACELELLISRAPDQWHLLQPNWPSDRRFASQTWP